MIHQLNSAHANDRLYVSLLLPDVQAVVDGRTLASLPISMANVLAPLRDNRGIVAQRRVGCSGNIYPSRRNAERTAGRILEIE